VLSAIEWSFVFGFEVTVLTRTSHPIASTHNATTINTFMAYEISANGKRRHAGAIASECNRDDPPALPGASGSTIGVHEMPTLRSRDSREKAQEAQKEPDQCDPLKSADT
jgi:hypothetical protein